MSVKKVILSWGKSLVFTMAVAYFFLFVTSVSISVPLVTLHYAGKGYLDEYMTSFVFISVFTLVGIVLSCLNLKVGRVITVKLCFTTLQTFCCLRICI